MNDPQDGEGLPPESHLDVPAKRKRNYEIVDAEALYALNPKLFKLVPDYKKISSAIKLGCPLPGIQMIEETQPEGEENAA